MLATSSVGPGSPVKTHEELNQKWFDWKICNIVRQMHADGTLWENVALAVSALALSVFVVWGGVMSIMNVLDAHEKLAQGNWVVKTYQYGTLIDCHPFSEWDVVQIYFGTALGIFALSLFAIVPCAFFSSLTRNIEHSSLAAAIERERRLSPSEPSS